MNKITTIIPVDKFDESIKSMLEMAVKSHIETSKDTTANLMFVGPKEVMDQIKELKLTDAEYVENENSWFSAQINAAVKKVKTDYFAILEYDDEFTPIWFKNVEKYFETGDDIAVYLPLT